jgi:1-acyl-sn-glycerol-3-phosphate acyltransferase
MTAQTSPTWLRVGATVAAGRLRPPVGSGRRRTVCGAARVLTGLGVRVEVHVPATAWPRTGTGLLLVSNTATALDPLALLTVVPGAAVAGIPDRVAGVPVPTVPAVSARVATQLRRGTPVCVRPEEGLRRGPGLGRFSPALLAAAVDAGAAVCPVAVRWRGAASPPPGGRSTVAAMRWLATSPGTVVEVHLLPALSSAGATPQELATTAEYAVAAALAAPSPAPSRGSGLVPGPAPSSRGVGRTGSFFEA